MIFGRNKGMRCDCSSGRRPLKQNQYSKGSGDWWESRRIDVRMNCSWSWVARGSNRPPHALAPAQAPCSSQSLPIAPLWVQRKTFFCLNLYNLNYDAYFYVHMTWIRSHFKRRILRRVTNVTFSKIRGWRSNSFSFYLIFGYQTYSLNKKPALCAVL